MDSPAFFELSFCCLGWSEMQCGRSWWACSGTSGLDHTVHPRKDVKKSVS